MLVVGPGSHFLSGISYYTAALTEALADGDDVAALLLRRLCPIRLYPGRQRAGQPLGNVTFHRDVPVFDGLDWWWGTSAVDALRFVRHIGPRVVLLQWWTATTAHSYLLLARAAKALGAKVVIEFHEIQDVGEADLPGAGAYARRTMRALLRRADGVVVHSQHDADEVARAYQLDARVPVSVIHHGPVGVVCTPARAAAASPAGRPRRLLYFGVVRPYKGLDELAEAYLQLLAEGEDLHLSVVGEVWQGYRSPLETLRNGAPHDRLTIVDRYVADAEVARCFAEADVAVLPYRRSSASGPLHLAMTHGMPVVTCAVGGLVEAAAGYTGAVLVAPRDPAALAAGIRKGVALVGQRHQDPHSWAANTRRYRQLFAHVGAPGPGHDQVPHRGAA